MGRLNSGDHLVSKSPVMFYNPAGFYIYLVKENVIPPTFESSRIKRLPLLYARKSQASSFPLLRILLPEREETRIDIFGNNIVNLPEVRTRSLSF